MKNRMIVTIEGTEGSGKTSVLHLIQAALASHGAEVFVHDGNGSHDKPLHRIDYDFSISFDKAIEALPHFAPGLKVHITARDL